MKILVVGDIHGEIKKLEEKIPKHKFDFVIGIGDYAGISDWDAYTQYIFRIKNRTEAKSPKEFFGKKRFQKLLKDDFKAGKNALIFLDKLGKPGFFVFGNGDDEWYNYPFTKIFSARKSIVNFWKKLKNLKEMTYRIRRYKGISFLGFGGYLDVTANAPLRDKEWQRHVDIRHEMARKKMISMEKEIGKKSIFILHYPPRGVFDIIKDKKNPYYGGSTGIDFYRKAIIKKKPFLVLCGHMHEYQGKKKLGESLVVNPGEGSKGEFAIIDINEKKREVNSVKFIK